MCAIVLTKEARSFIVDTFATAELKIYGWILNAEVVIIKESVVISPCCFAEAGTDFFISIARIARLFFLRPIKFLMYGAVIVVLVVDAKAPCFVLVFFLFCSVFVLLFFVFFWGRDELFHKYVAHVQHEYFSSFNQSDHCLWRCLCRSFRPCLNCPIKDVRANCLCAALLRRQRDVICHASFHVLVTIECSRR